MWHFQSTNTRKLERLQERGSREVFRDTPINISNTRKSVSSGFETSGFKNTRCSLCKKKKKKKKKNASGIRKSNIVPKVLRLFGQWLVWRDPGEIKDFFDWLPCKGLHCFTAEILREKNPVLQHLSWRPTAGQRA